MFFKPLITLLIFDLETRVTAQNVPLVCPLPNFPSDPLLLSRLKCEGHEPPRGLNFFKRPYLPKYSPQDGAITNLSSPCGPLTSPKVSVRQLFPFWSNRGQSAILQKRAKNKGTPPSLCSDLNENVTVDLTAFLTPSTEFRGGCPSGFRKSTTPIEVFLQLPPQKNCPFVIFPDFPFSVHPCLRLYS